MKTSYEANVQVYPRLHFYHKYNSSWGKKKKKAIEPRWPTCHPFFSKLIIAINILEAKKGTTSSRVIIYIKQGRPAWEGEVLS